MANSKANLLLHPVRLRLVTELLGRQMTAGQLAGALPDIPQATLYRHIKRLFEAGIFVVVAETAVNGAIERTYAVAEGQANLSPEEMHTATPAEHINYFSIFAASLIDTFTRYANAAAPKAIGHDGLSYNQTIVYLSAKEKAHLEQQLNQLIGQIMSNGPANNRQRFTLASVVIPDERPNSNKKES